MRIWILLVCLTVAAIANAAGTTHGGGSTGRHSPRIPDPPTGKERSKDDGKSKTAAEERVEKIHRAYRMWRRFLVEYHEMNPKFKPFDKELGAIKEAMLDKDPAKAIEKFIEVLMTTKKEAERDSATRQYRSIFLTRYRAEMTELSKIINFEELNAVKEKFYGTAGGKAEFDGMVRDIDQFPKASLNRLLAEAAAKGILKETSVDVLEPKDEATRAKVNDPKNKSLYQLHTLLDNINKPSNRP